MRLESCLIKNYFKIHLDSDINKRRLCRKSHLSFYLLMCLSLCKMWFFILQDSSVHYGATLPYCLWSALEMACKLSSQEKIRIKIVPSAGNPNIHVSPSRNISPLLSTHLTTFNLSTFAGRERIWAQPFLSCPRDSCLFTDVLKSGGYMCLCRMDIRSIPIRTEIKTL